jgi:hypothetical protein
MKYPKETVVYSLIVASHVKYTALKVDRVIELETKRLSFLSSSKKPNNLTCCSLKRTQVQRNAKERVVLH